MAQAFADVNTLVNTSNGFAASSTQTVTIPTAELYTLANILSACINSTGVGDNASCDHLFTYTTIGSSVPSDVVSAALNIARNPSTNVTGLMGLVMPTAPFAPTLSTVNDLTVTVAYSGNAINTPTSLAVDAGGNVWATNAGSVTELSHTGAVLSGPNGYAAGAVNAPTAIALDASGNAWVANSGSSKLLELSSAGATVGTYSGNGLNAPSALAFDGQGNVWVGNAGASVVSEFSATGAPVTSVATTTPAIALALNPR